MHNWLCSFSEHWRILLWLWNRLISTHIIQGYFTGTGQSHQCHITVSSHKRHGVSNHQHLDCVLNRLFKLVSKKISKLRVTGLCEGNTSPHKGPVTGKVFPFNDAIMSRATSGYKLFWQIRGWTQKHNNNTILHLETQYLFICYKSW